MGASSSKGEKSEALRLCKERKRFIKQALDSRYALAAAHVSYVQSLRNIGIALRRYAEAEVLLESTLSTSATELDKTPSHSSYLSPSPSHIGGVADSPVLNGSPYSPITTRLSYMRSGGASAVTVTVSPPPRNMYVEDGEFSTPPPPPPPPPESGSSWDFFDPLHNSESFRFVGHNDEDMNEMRMFGQFSQKSVGLDGSNDIEEEFLTPKSEPRSNGKMVTHNSESATPDRTKNNSEQNVACDIKCVDSEEKVDGSAGTLVVKAGPVLSTSKKHKPTGDKEICAEREDPSEFITHRAKDFLLSIKDIEHRFFRASESGKEVSRMLEANKIRVGYSEAKGKSPASIYLASFGSGCCRGRTTNLHDEVEQHATKVITWKRTTSSRSSSSRNPLTTVSKDDNDDSGSDFIEEFCMIAGSHSSTLERLYAWERKLYDEVKASESIRKEYDKKCDQLRQQFAQDVSTQIIDRTRAIAKDLHSRIRVALHAVDTISKRIEKMRDEELLPQLLELIQGSIRMWKAMLECHHAQYITISLAYHAKTSAGTPWGDAQKQIMAQLQDEVECFGLSFADWINSLTLYVEALNCWLQNCILQPRERSKGRRAFSPRRVLAPPIFVLFRDWSVGIKSLPSQELSDAIRAFLYELRHSIAHQAEESHESKPDSDDNGDPELKAEEKKDDKTSNLSSIHTSLTKVLDRLTKFSEDSLKMFEDIKQKCETARTAYVNCRPPPRAFSI